MAKAKLSSTSMSEYSSIVTESVESAISCSDEEPREVLIFYHEISNLKTPVKEAAKILYDAKITAKNSTEICYDSGRSKTDLYVAHAKSSKYKIFVVNKSFSKHDLASCRCILDNSRLCTPENTLFLCRNVHKNLIPVELRYFPVKVLSNRVNGDEIAEKILTFREEHQCENAEPLEKLQISVPEDQRNAEFETKKKLFLEMIDRFDKRRIFILCTCVKPSKEGASYAALSRVTWLKVFDFDCQSETEGLLSSTRGDLVQGRFAITSTKRKPEKLNLKVTDWTIVEDVKAHELDKEDFLSDHISSISRFSAGQKPATMLVLWYHKDPSGELEENLGDFITNLNYEFKPRGIKIVLCLPDVPDDGTDLARTSRRHIQDRRVIAPIEKICEWISEIPTARPDSGRQLALPKLKEEEEEGEVFVLDEGDVNWLGIDMEVLTSSALHAPQVSKPDIEFIGQKGLGFLKGGDISWEVLEDGSYDVPRDITKAIVEYLKVQHIQKGASGVVTLLHSPGSGGTTIGRSVVWELRNDVPCLVLEQKTEVREEFKEKIKFVRDKSNLPVLLLVDGRSSQEVRNILDMCRYERVVILHVIRCYAQIDRRNSMRGNFFLPDLLSPNEAAQFQTKLIKYGNAGIKKRMADLTKDVESGERRTIFEYGLTAFHSEFRGVAKYVESHMLLRNKTEKWHLVVALLSLANYYANCGLPAEFFSLILKKSKYEIVDLQTDVPEWGQHLIRECDDCDWKISHYLVAKEILEQYLGGNMGVSNTEELSLGASKKLPRLAGEFLDCAKEHAGSQDNLREDFYAILNGVFIMRYDKEEYGNDESKRKSDYSRLITNILDQEERKKIFRKLVEYFPYNPEFHAHYGRFLAKTKHHKEAVEVLNKAVAIRTSALQTANVDPAVNGDEVLYRIHSMFGFAYNAHVRHIFGDRGVGFMVESSYSKTSDTDMKTACNSASRAIDEFKKCRGFYCPSVRPTYGFTGEIRVRLYITEFCRKRANYDLDSVSRRDHRLHFFWKFIEDSFVECEFLLDQCMTFAADNPVVQREVHKYLNLYDDYYGSAVRNLSKWAGDGKTFSSKRCRVTLLKMELKRKQDVQRREFRVFEDLKMQSDVQRFLLSIETVLDDPSSRDSRMTPYMEDWMRVIRLPMLSREYHLSKVQARINIWDGQKERGSFSTFYKYVVQFLVTSFSNNTPANQRLLEQYKSQLDQSQRSLRQSIVEKPIEWIKSVIPQNRNTIGMLLHCHQADQPRQMCTGNVVEARGWYGQIEMTGTKLRIFFVPRKFGVRWFHAKEKRLVCFFIGFNAKNGAQAYEVGPAVLCSTCKNIFDPGTVQQPFCPLCGVPIVLV